MVQKSFGVSQEKVLRLAGVYRIKEVKMSRSRTMKPGETAPDSGQYEIIGPRGGKTGVERTVTKGEPLPPTPARGEGYKLVDKTKH